NDHSGNFLSGEDSIRFCDQCIPKFSDGFNPGLDDSTNGGTSDGTGASGNAAGFTILELSHPLNSGDSKDFSLSPGLTVGFILLLQINGPTGVGSTSFPG